MRRPAVLGARAAKGARARGLDRQSRHATGDHVHLAGKRWHPERMDHIGAREVQLDTLTHRKTELVRGLDLSVRRHILDAPPPLLRRDPNGETTFRPSREDAR